MKIIDMHCDTISKLWARMREGMEASLAENSGHVDLVRMKESGYLLQNFAIFVNIRDCSDPWERFLTIHDFYREELKKNSDRIAPVLRYGDIADNEAAGKMSAMLTVEEGAVCKGEIDRLKVLYRLGVRMMTLSWNYPNELGYPNLDGNKGKKVWGICSELKTSALTGEDYEVRQKQVQEIFDEYFYTPNVTEGLTEKGKEFVCEMEKLGMIVDVSHLSDAGFYDVLDNTHKPFVASHSNARGICRCVRNLSDDMIGRLAERGGCMGLNFCADFLKDVPAGTGNPGTIGDVVRHAHYITDRGGIEVLGLGSDFDGIDTNKELPGAESMEILWDALHQSGYTERELDKIFYQNVLRVYQEILE